MDGVRSRLASLEFDYVDPYPGFDRAKVQGLIATLISILPANHSAATALEICAGGRLYNVVVENAEIGTALLNRGQLRKRVTLIPIDKISGALASKEMMERVVKVSENKAALALSLIGFEPEVERAMIYIFGNTLICPNGEIAKKVTFEQTIKMKSVTLEGDVYDPSGTLSGGSKPKSGGILIKVQELNALGKELEGRKRVLGEIEKEWNEAKGEMETFKLVKKALELKIHEVGLLEEQVQESNATRVSPLLSDYGRGGKLMVDFDRLLVKWKE